MKTREFRIRIFQPIVPEYRVALFNGLGRKYLGRIDIQAAQTRRRENSYPLSEMPYDYSHGFIHFGPFLWQKGFSLQGLKRGDVVVVCGDIHELSSIAIALRARLRGLRVIWWGHHVSAQAKELKVKIRLWIAKRLADVMLCYTDAGVDYLERRGFVRGRVFATGNTMDIAAVAEATRYMNDIGSDGCGRSRLEVFKCQHGLTGKKILLFCGVMRYKVRVDVLLKALKRLRGKRSDLHCVFIGGGELFDEWRKLGEKLGVSHMVTWVGELRSQAKLAPWFLSADIFVYPGRIGLSLIHAFAYGLPVILNDNALNHGPEYVVFKPGENGLAFKENDDEHLASIIDMALQDKNLFRLGQAGNATVEKNYSMTRMIERYSESIEAAATGVM